MSDSRKRPKYTQLNSSHPAHAEIPAIIVGGTCDVGNVGMLGLGVESSTSPATGSRTIVDQAEFRRYQLTELGRLRASSEGKIEF